MKKETAEALQALAQAAAKHIGADPESLTFTACHSQSPDDDGIGGPDDALMCGYTERETVYQEPYDDDACWWDCDDHAQVTCRNCNGVMGIACAKCDGRGWYPCPDHDSDGERDE